MMPLSANLQTSATATSDSSQTGAGGAQAGGAGMRGSFVNNFAAEGASLSASTGTGGGLAALPWYAWAALAAAAVFLFMVLKKKL